MPVPKSIKVFLAFSAAVSLLELTIFVPQLTWLKGTVTPFMGWAGNMPFFFALGSWPGLFKGAGYSIDAKTLRRYLTFACFLMAIGVAAGAVDFWMFGSLRSDENPWIRYHPLRPLWTIVLPLAWGIVLWIVRARIDPQSVDPRSGVQQHEASGPPLTSASFFGLFWCAVIAWAYEALHYWGLWWGYWGTPHKPPLTKWVLIVLAIAGIASLLAGVVFRKREKAAVSL
jgi:hypothetical protein